MPDRTGFHFDVKIASSVRLAAGGLLILGAVLWRRHPHRPCQLRAANRTAVRCHTVSRADAVRPRLQTRGYTIGGGQFKTTPFASFEDNSKTGPKGNAKTAALSSFVDDLTNGGKNRLPLSMESILAYGPTTKMPTKAPAVAPATSSSHDVWIPPIAVMGIVGFTHTEADQDPTGSPYRPNDNGSGAGRAFYGGAITDHIGAFAQVTYTGPGFGAPGDPFTHNWTWDNTDVRYADSGKLGDLDVVWGITANNNPTVQDAWNTIPAWVFPYAASTVAPTPATHTLIHGTFGVSWASVPTRSSMTWCTRGDRLQDAEFQRQNRLGADPSGRRASFRT